MYTFNKNVGFSFILLLVANPCNARESYHFFPNDVTLAIGVQHRFSSSTFLFFNFIYFMSSTKYSMHSLYFKNVEVKLYPQITKYKSLIPLCFNLKPNCA